MHIIVVLGPPGVGKGTQGSLLAKNLNFIHVSTGELFREEIKKKTNTGIKISNLLSLGKFVPDEIVIRLVENIIHNNKDARGMILDGFPRTIPQARFLSELLNKEHIKKVTAIYLDANERTLLKRLIARSTIEHRTDDAPEVIRRRFEIYNKETAPLIEYFKKNHHLISVSGMGSVESIQKQVIEELPELLDRTNILFSNP